MIAFWDVPLLAGPLEQDNHLQALLSVHLSSIKRNGLILIYIRHNVHMKIKVKCMIKTFLTMQIRIDPTRGFPKS